jgi:integrase
LIRRRNEIKEGKQPEVKRITNHSFRELANEYVVWSQRQRGFQQKLAVIKQLLDAFGHYQLRLFTSKLLEQHQTERMKKGNKPATVNRHLATIKHMFTKAVDWDMVEGETLKRIRRVKLLEENNRRHLRPIVVIALNTGMRKSEVLLLKWDNVDLKHGFLLLEMTKNGERREIPINESVREELLSLTRRLDVPHVFYDRLTGKPYDDVKRSFKSACRRAGIKDFRFHDLRHTFASHLVMARIDLTTVRELLGHKTLTMTLRYAHLAPTHKVKALDVLDKTLSDRSSAQLLHKKGATSHDEDS